VQEERVLLTSQHTPKIVVAPAGLFEIVPIQEQYRPIPMCLYRPNRTAGKAADAQQHTDDAALCVSETCPQRVDLGVTRTPGCPLCLDEEHVSATFSDKISLPRLRYTSVQLDAEVGITKQAGDQLLQPVAPSLGIRTLSEATQLV
jgi:hypothetical protein